MVVFISSSQREFKSLRTNLKSAIDTEELAHQRISKGVQIEHEKGLIDEDIQEAMEQASVYVGVIGARNSPWTKREFRIALSRGLPLLVYQFQKKANKKRSGMQKFVKSEIRSRRIRVRGPYTAESSLIDAILNDLAIEATELAKEAARVRKTIHRRKVAV